MKNNEIMTIKDLSLYLKINEKTIYKLAKQGKLPGIKIGGMWRFKKEVLDNWIMNAGKQIKVEKMEDLGHLILKENEKKALLELKERLLEGFPDAKIILYGSKARGVFNKESDIDVLIILKNKVDDSLREKIFSISFKIELKYDVIFGILVESEDFWNSPPAKAMPIHGNIDREGILVK
ncbi:MAG: helix-turn-helix domain-containing protein [Actinobacteria bacterium]|nr:helix-turn-helix domain-containing protein [Actinomycetota bacterium]